MVEDPNAVYHTRAVKTLKIAIISMSVFLVIGTVVMLTIIVTRPDAKPAAVGNVVAAPNPSIVPYTVQDTASDIYVTQLPEKVRTRIQKVEVGSDHIVFQVKPTNEDAQYLVYDLKTGHLIGKFIP